MPEGANRHVPPPTRVSEAPEPRRRHFQLSPIVTIAVIAAGVAWGFGLDSDRPGLQLREPPTVSPAEAVDISLQRLMRSRVIQRLQEAHRLNESHQRNREILDDELRRIRMHPLYVVIHGMMTEHLRTEGYERVTIRAAPDQRDSMLSMEAETTLNLFIHSLRASFPAPNEKIASFLKDQEDISGKPIVERRSADRYDAAFTFLILLLFDYPDEFKPVAGAVNIYPRSSQDIERGIRGGVDPTFEPPSSTP
jgi:hypothetical protein